MKIMRPSPGFSRYQTRGPAPVLRTEIPSSGHGGFTMWTKPQFTEMRFGFEVTLYIANR